MNSETSRVNKVLVLAAVLCSYHNVAGVQSFAGAAKGRGIGHHKSNSLGAPFVRDATATVGDFGMRMTSMRGGEQTQEEGGEDVVAGSGVQGVEVDISGDGESEAQTLDQYNEEVVEEYTEKIIAENLKLLGLNDTISDTITTDDDETPTVEVTTTTTSKRHLATTDGEISSWPCMDSLDKRLIKIALPCIANFAINPLVGAVDLFWINRMGNTLAVAGQAAANQIFSSAFWLTSFLPSVTATLVAKERAKGDEEGVQDAISQALIVGFFVAVIGSSVVLSRPDSLLTGVLKEGAPAREFARPYLLIRGFAFLPSLFSLIGFSAFRGVMDTVTPLKISLFANLMNAVLDPFLIFNAGMGVTGAALATLGAEVSSAVLFMSLLFKKNLIVAKKLFRMPKLEKLLPLLQGGAALQLRNFALNLTFLAVTRVTQSIDDTGVAAAAHAMAIQTFQIGGIVLLALSTVAQFVVPGEMVEKVDEVTGEKSGGLLAAKAVVNRLMTWGFLLGSVLGLLQVALIPTLQKASPVLEVRQAARNPALLASLYQAFNGLVFIGEGVMVGTGSFLQLSLSTVIATFGTIIALKKLPAMYGLTGVWMSFGVFNILRLIGVYIHQNVNGPLAKSKIEEAMKA